jgi:hypothetical protein
MYMKSSHYIHEKYIMHTWKCLTLVRVTAPGRRCQTANFQAAAKVVRSRWHENIV